MRVGQLSPKRHLTRALVHRQVREQQLARLRIGRAVIEQHAHGGRLRGVGRLQAAAADRLAQPQHVGHRLGEVHVQGVDLLDHRHRCGVALADQGAFGDQGPADAPCDRRSDRRIAQVDARGLQRRRAGGDVGLGLFAGRHRIGVVLLTDGIGADQRLVPLGGGGGLHQGGLRLGEHGAGAVHRRLEGGRVDAVQHLALAHIRAFAELPRHDDAGHPRTDLCRAQRFESSGQVHHQSHRFGSHSDHGDLGRRHGRRAGPLAGWRRRGCLPAGCQQAHEACRAHRPH